MRQDPSIPLARLTCGDEAYLCLRPPATWNAAVEARLAEALSALPAPPALIYWDAVARDGARVAWGRGGLDPLLAAGWNLTGCVAVAEKTFGRLVERGAVDRGDLARAAALLVRSPGAGELWCPGLTGGLDLRGSGVQGGGKGTAASAERISLVVLYDSQAPGIEPLVEALRTQEFSGPLEMVVVASGLDAAAAKLLAAALEEAGRADPRLRIRRHLLQGPLTPAYAANVGVSLANAEAVVVADVRAAPVTPGTIQRLADWVLGGEVATACPRLSHGPNLVAAGLAFGEETEEGERIVLWNQTLLSDQVRTAAAPAPWFFALRRSAWLAAGGVHGSAQERLWTAELAAAHAPHGRCVLVGSELVEWTEAEPPAAWDVSTAAPRRVQPYAAAALREPVRSEEPMAAGPRRAAPLASTPWAADGDRFPNLAETRLLVLCDAAGPSQSIAFMHGLAEARAEGRVAVRLVEESAFAGDSRSLVEQPALTVLERHLEEVRPDVLVASRLGHAAAWEALYAAGRRLGLPIVFHLDDDLMEIPPVLGVERWRLARSPKRLRTLQDALVKADLVLASTPSLGERLRRRAGHDRIAVMANGTGGRPPAPRPPRPPTGRILIGYMGSASHDHDLAMVVPALNAVLERYEHVDLMLFGSIAEQSSTRSLHPRVQRRPGVFGDYAAFRARLADLCFDIGLAPLRANAFNDAKTATKWVEYAEAGATVLASRAPPYMPVAEAGALLAVEPHRWEAGLRRLIEDPALRQDLRARADELLLESFGWERLERSVLEALDRATARLSNVA